MYTCVQAAHAAYSEHLEPFHNWLLKNTFAVALNGIPTRREIFQRLGPHLQGGRREQIVAQELREYAEVVKQLTDYLRGLAHLSPQREHQRLGWVD